MPALASLWSGVPIGERRQGSQGAAVLLGRELSMAG